MSLSVKEKFRYVWIMMFIVIFWYNNYGFDNGIL